jgi:hypothetical protein
MNKVASKIVHEYNCKECNKIYSSYHSLWNHNKKYHSDNILKKPDNILKKPDNILKKSDNILKKPDNIKTHYPCRYCDKIFNNIKTRWSHEKKCKIKKDNSTEIELEKIKLAQMEEENKLKMINIKQLELQIKLAKINKNNIINNSLINNNSHNQTNNGIINNVFVKYNDVSYNTLTNKERNEIFNSYNMIEESIKKIHFNPKLPEQNNLYITNLKDPYCNVFDGKQFSTLTKNELLPDLIDLHLFELYLSKNKYKLKKTIRDKISKLEEKLNKDNKKYTDENDKIHKNYKEYMVEIIKLLIYNSCDKNKLNTIKKIDDFIHKELK